MPSLGIGFQPSADTGGAGRSESTPLESVVKLLSLRLPSVVGARGIAPRELLAAPGMAGQSGTMGEQQWLQMLRRLMGGGDAAFGGVQSQASLGASATPPRVTPGLGGTSQTPRVTPGQLAPAEDPAPSTPAQTSPAPFNHAGALERAREQLFRGTGIQGLF